jgi:hypothetical protein
LDHFGLRSVHWKQAQWPRRGPCDFTSGMEVQHTLTSHVVRLVTISAVDLQTALRNCL